MRAKENLKGLYYTYKNELQKRIIFIMVNGKSSKKFAETFLDSGLSGASFSAEEFYTNIIDRIAPEVYTNKSLSNSMVEIIGAHLEDRAMEIGVNGYPALLYKSEYAAHINNKEELVDVFAKMLNEQVGGEFVGVDYLDQATSKAVKEEFTGKVLPIIVHSQNNELLNSLAKDFYERLTPNVFTVTAGIAPKEISEQSLTTVTGKITKTSITNTIKSIKAAMQ
jgi:hypothetical protein